MQSLLNFAFVWVPASSQLTWRVFAREAFSTHRYRVPTISKTPIESISTALQELPHCRRVEHRQLCPRRPWAPSQDRWKAIFESETVVRWFRRIFANKLSVTA